MASKKKHARSETTEQDHEHDKQQQSKQKKNKEHNKEEDNENEDENDEQDGNGDGNGDGEGVELKKFDDETSKQIDAIRKYQEQLSDINERQGDEVVAVEKKFDKVRRPFYDKRQNILKQIPEFWLRVFRNHGLADEADEDALKYLEQLDVIDTHETKLAYRINFTFKQNPIFKDTVLYKEIYQDENKEIKCRFSGIQWLNEKYLDENPQSFLRWFCEEDGLELCELIKEQLWPDPLPYFLSAPHEHGDDCDHGDDDDDGHGDEDGDDDGNDDDGEDNDEEEEDDGAGAVSEAELRKLIAAKVRQQSANAKKNKK